MNTTASPFAPLNVIPLPIDKKAKRRAEDKWTAAVIKLGYTPLPSLLLRAQAKLKLTSPQLNVLIQIIEHWWEAGKDPFPAKETIARRMDVSPRQVQRILTQLEKAGHIKRIKRYLGHKAQTSNGYSLDGLVKKLVALEPEFRKAAEQNKIRKKKVEAA
jgi:DNA-binding transcriptional regulator YhcF (GntR family)